MKRIVALGLLVLMVCVAVSASAMQIFVRPLVGGVFRLEVENSDTIYSVKQKIYNETKIPPARQRLTYGNTLLLQDGWTLQAYGVRNEGTLGLQLLSGDGSEELPEVPGEPGAPVVVEVIATEVNNRVSLVLDRAVTLRDAVGQAVGTLAAGTEITPVQIAEGLVRLAGGTYIALADWLAVLGN